ncbi:hypothetical protein LCGC14_3161180, partial [marine sediment metagenome]
MKSITLFNPPSPWMISDRALVPLGLLYLAGYLREKEIDVKLVDLSGKVVYTGKNNSKSTIRNYLKEYEIPESDYYGISFVSPQFIYAK